MPKKPKNLYNDLRNLKVLSLVGGAKWRILPELPFENLPKFKDLRLSFITLEEFSENAFKDMVKVNVYFQNEKFI